MTSTAVPGASIQDLIALIQASALLVGIVALGFTLVGVIATWRADPGGTREFFRMFERMQILQVLTVMLVVASATVLALLGVVDSNGVTGILGGVAGYVLGGLNRSGGGRPQERDEAGGQPPAP